MENNGKNSAVPLVIISLVILLLVIGAYWFGKNSIVKNKSEEVTNVVEKEEKTEESTESTVSENETKEGQEDANTEVQAVEGPEESNEEVIETLELIFAQKYEKKVDDITVRINQREGDYVVGSVSFADDVGGGYVLAAKVNEVWKIIFDGNGNIVCSAVDDIDFPVSLVSECWDETKMGVRSRAEPSE